MIFWCEIDPNVASDNGVVIRGTPDCIGVSDDFTDIVAGVPVTRVGVGLHDGQHAAVITLNKTGRFAARIDEDVEWIRDFGASGRKARDAFIQSVTDANTKPKVLTHRVDITIEDVEDDQLVLAEWSADYGVSFTKISDGPQWPVYDVFGLRDKVILWLTTVYGYDEGDIRAID